MSECPHGRTRYLKHKCRCEVCRRANREYRLAYDRRPGGRVQSERDGELAVNCWCEASIQWVPLAEVQACRTRSCGAPGCSEERMAS